MLLFCTLALAQEFPIYPEIQANEPYHKIETELFRLIYPAQNSELAFELANMLDYYSPQIRKDAVNPIDILVQPYMATSNAFVSYFPRRSVFFTQPYMSTDPSSMGTSLSWDLAISIHEMQHVAQQDRSYHAGGEGAYILLGETGWAVINSLSQPIWFAEGEAVMTETLLSPAGRGRTFGFIGSSIALYEQYGPLNYAASYFGSFKTYIPDHYRIGWIMTDYGHQQYGSEFWPAVSRTASSNTFRFFPFEKALFNISGMRFQDWHNRSIDAKIQAWRTSNQDKKISDTQLLYADDSGFPTKFLSPIARSKGDILALRKGSEQIADIVRIENGQLTQSVLVGQRNASNFAADSRFIVWDAFVDHPLRSGLRYSDLFVYDETEQKKSRITQKGYFFSPALDQNHQLVAVHNSPQGSSALAFFDLTQASSKMVPKRMIPAPEGVLYDPHWESEKTILLIRRERTKGNILCRYHLDSGTFEDIGEWTWNLLSHPTSNSEWIFVVESLPYSDDVIAIPKSGGPSRRAVHRPYGLRDPHYDPHNNRLILSEMTHTGSQLVAMELKPELWPERIPAENAVELNIPEQDWNPQNHHAITGIFKPYAWTPNLSLIQSDIGLQVNAQDPTGRWTASQGVLYNINKQGVWGQSSLTATRLWPHISIESRYGRRSERDITQIPEEPEPGFKLSELPTQEWREQMVLFGVDFPMSWSTSTHTSTLSLQLQGGFQKADELIFSNGQASSSLQIPLGMSYPIQGHLSIRHLSNPSVLDIFPRLGLKMDIGHARIISEMQSQNSYVSHQFFLPGFLSQHHLLLYAAAEQRLGPYPMPYQTRLARGWGTQASDVFNTSSSYVFPLSYPDIAWRRILYIKRIRSGFFLDAMWTNNTAEEAAFFDPNLSVQNSKLSYGINITIDAHLMRLPMLLPLGIDVGYIPEQDLPYIGPSIDILY